MKTIEVIKLVTEKLRRDITAAGDSGNGMVSMPAESFCSLVGTLVDCVAEQSPPLLLKGIGKIAGDGFKDETRIGEVIYAWNREHPAPHAPGQFPRLGNPVHAASTEQFAFFPVEDDELIAVVDRRIEELRMQVQTLQDEKRELLRTHAGAQAASSLAKLAAYPLTEHDEARPDRALFSAGDTSGDWTLKVADVQHARAALKAGRGAVTADRTAPLALIASTARSYANYSTLSPACRSNLIECIEALEEAATVRGPREAQAEPVAGVHWYCLAATGTAMLCTDEEDARHEAAECDRLYPMHAPHRAVQLVPATPPTTDAPAQWISVDERLPTPRDDGSDVPVWTWNGEFVTEDDYAEQFEQPAGPAVGGWVSTGWGFGQDYSLGRAAVTHWMPREAPKPPTAAPAQEGAPK